MNSNKIRQAFYEDPEVMSMLDAQDREELVQKVNKISTPDLALILKGDKGDMGEKGDTGDQGPRGEKGDTGRDGRNGRDGESIMGPRGEAGKDSVSEHKTEIIREELTLDDKIARKIVAAISKLPEKYRLDVSSLRNVSSFLHNGKRYEVSELMHGGGSSTSGSSLKQETPTGTVDDSNTTFTVAHEPFYINVNGADYFVGTGSYTSYAAGTITLSSAVGLGGFIRSIYQS